jgi:dienelactone hydrolase
MLMDQVLPRQDVGRPVQLLTALTSLEGYLSVPPEAKGIVLLAHGNGSGQYHSHNCFVADTLHQGGLATLLIDLLASREAVTGDRNGYRQDFNVNLAAERLIIATDWLRQQQETEHLRIGYFGAGAGTAAALVAASKRPETVSAIVSHDGRPDLAEEALAEVRIPILLIVGAQDFQVIGLNERALAQLWTRKKMEILPGAGHIPEETGSLTEMARLALRWFWEHLNGR